MKRSEYACRTDQVVDERLARREKQTGEHAHCKLITFADTFAVFGRVSLGPKLNKQLNICLRVAVHWFPGFQQSVVKTFETREEFALRATITALLCGDIPDLSRKRTIGDYGNVCLGCQCSNWLVCDRSYGELG